MKKELIVKSNEIIEGQYHWSLTETKILAKLVTMINKEDERFKLHRFTTGGMLKALQMNPNNHKELKKAVDGLVDRSIRFGKDESELTISVLSSAEYFNDGTIELEFSPKLKPYLLQLKENFTKYHLENLLELRSFYSIRIYELLKQYQKIKKRKIELDDLRRYLDIEDKYTRYNDFKRKVILKAQEELKEKTDISFEFKEIKTGRKITTIEFSISENQIIFSQKVLDLFDFLPEDEKIESSKEKIKKYLDKYSTKRVKRAMQYCKKSNCFEFWKYFSKAIREDYEKEEEQRKIEQKQLQEELRQELLEKEKGLEERRKQFKKEVTEKANIKKENMEDREIKKYKKEYGKLKDNVKRLSFQNDFELFLLAKSKQLVLDDM